MAGGSLPELDPELGGIAGSHDGSGLRIAVVATRWNADLVQRLVGAAHRAGADHEVAELAQVWVPGAFELPVVCQRLATQGDYDAIVALGVVIRGETTHYELVSEISARGIARVALDTGVPVILGVLSTENKAQVLDRSGDDDTNQGYQAVVTAIEMANVLAKLG